VGDAELLQAHADAIVPGVGAMNPEGMS
jgi:hypothetical protein